MCWYIKERRGQSFIRKSTMRHTWLRRIRMVCFFPPEKCWRTFSVYLGAMRKKKDTWSPDCLLLSLSSQRASQQRVNWPLELHHGRSWEQCYAKCASRFLGRESSNDVWSITFHLMCFESLRIWDNLSFSLQRKKKHMFDLFRPNLQHFQIKWKSSLQRV